MATNESQLAEPYTEAYLKGLQRDEVRRITMQQNISNVKPLEKDQVIRAIFNIQNQRPQNPQLPRPIEREDSDLESYGFEWTFQWKNLNIWVHAIE